MGASGRVEWAVAGRPIEGEIESGDLHIVHEGNDRVLLGVVDGLGHGPEAAAASRRAAETLRATALDLPLEQLFRQCHAALRTTRGAVMSLAIVDAGDGSLTWGGIGNVEGYVVDAGGRRRDSIPLRGGVVGGHLPTVRSETTPLAAGDLIVLTTDGIVAGFAEKLVAGAPTAMAERILASYARANDDALVLVARYPPTGP
jgi:serine phosphatase RsbU (regulator of sigma subunit)